MTRILIWYLWMGFGKGKRECNKTWLLSTASPSLHPPPLLSLSPSLFIIFSFSRSVFCPISWFFSLSDFFVCRYLPHTFTYICEYIHTYIHDCTFSPTNLYNYTFIYLSINLAILFYLSICIFIYVIFFYFFLLFFYLSINLSVYTLCICTWMCIPKQWKIILLSFDVLFHQ